MRQVFLTKWFACLLISTLLAGCSTDLAQIFLEGEQTRLPQPTPDAPANSLTTTTPKQRISQKNQTSTLNTQAEQEAQRLLKALAQYSQGAQRSAPQIAAASIALPTPPVPPVPPLPSASPIPTLPPTSKASPIQWLDLPPAPVVPKQTTVMEPTPESITPGTITPAPVTTVAASQPSMMSSTHTDDLVEQLITQIRTGDQSPFVKAMTLSTLGLAASGQPLTSEDLAGLDPQQARQVRKLHALVLAATATNNPREKPSTDQQSAMRDQLDHLFGPRTVSIGQIRLCRTVLGYGVYEPFESTTFLAGREQPVILYVELDQFSSIADGSQYRVRLSQKIDLFTEADGVRVWHLPQEQIEDTSRNRRRDFFTVQLLRIPARLGVGQYRLKVRIHDRNGESFDETTIPITIVANKFETAKATKR